MRRLAVPLVLFSALALAAGGSAGTPSGSPISARELPGIVDPMPKLPQWSFEEGDPYLCPIPSHAPAFTLPEWLGESPTSAKKVVAGKLRKAGFIIGRHLVWNGNRPFSADAAVFAYLFRTAWGARNALTALRRGLGRGPVKGLGEQSFGLHHRGTGADGDFAVYLWRRGNLVVLTEIACDASCGFLIVAPARAYAGQIDARAKRAA